MIRVTISPSPDAGERLLWDVERPPVLVYDAAVELVAIPRESSIVEAQVDDVAVESVTLTGVGDSHAVSVYLPIFNALPVGVGEGGHGWVTPPRPAFGCGGRPILHGDLPIILQHRGGAPTGAPVSTCVTKVTNVDTLRPATMTPPAPSPHPRTGPGHRRGSSRCATRGPRAWVRRAGSAKRPPPC